MMVVDIGLSFGMYFDDFDVVVCDNGDKSDDEINEVDWC